MVRTTLDIDDAVLAAARTLSTEHGISLGAAVSELARRRPARSSRLAVRLIWELTAVLDERPNCSGRRSSLGVSIAGAPI
jgi:hypothetical protein